VISGRGAAIGIRTIPLPRSVYDSLKCKHIVEGSEDDLLVIGKSLRCSRCDESATAQTVFGMLLKSLDAVDANGNALLESPVLLSGASVKAVQSSNGEVYTKAPKEKTEDGYSESFPETVEGLREYQSIQQHIRGGLVGEGTETGNNDVADSMALEKWRQDMRGSALAGFQLAMRAGPLCEEPVRGVAVVLESVEIAVTEESCGSYKAAKDLTGGMVVAALRSGIRCALL
jgi:translation elongation factor EF-G